jgi:membrane associated rhomboid family serine protease
VLKSIGSNIPEMLALHNTNNPLFQPFQLFTYMFMHSLGDVFHVFFNMFAFAQFGPQLESHLGSKRFGNFVMICGVGVGAAWLAWNQLAMAGYIDIGFLENGGIVGFSGVMFGIFALMALYFPEMQLQLLIPPIPVKMKTMMLLYIGLEFYMLMSNKAGDNISHISHLLGVVFAVILYNIWHYIDSNKTHR